MSPALALQIALRSRLTAASGVTALVPAEAIFDRSGRPERFPCIILGEDQEIDPGLTLDRDHVRVVSTLHLWQREAGLTGVKTIAGAIRTALVGADLDLNGANLVDLNL